MMEIELPASPSVAISQHKYLRPEQFCARVAYPHLLCTLQMANTFCSRVQHWLQVTQSIHISMNS
jgi:hypothetical protein